ncbi:MAG TPA: hypothetical protein VGM50_12710 [Gemmatimonadaceae bacterium]
MRLRCHIASVLFALAVDALGASIVRAQSSSNSLIPIPTRTYVGINPIGLPFDIATVEVESAVAPGITLGGVGSYINVGHPNYTTAEFKVRYYPGEVVLRGPSVGATLGVTHITNHPDGDRQTLTAPTLGIIVDYNWLYGRQEHFLIGTGVGAKRVLASEADRDRVDIDRAIFTARLIFGYVF